MSRTGVSKNDSAKLERVMKSTASSNRRIKDDANDVKAR